MKQLKIPSYITYNNWPLCPYCKKRITNYKANYHSNPFFTSKCDCSYSSKLLFKSSLSLVKPSFEIVGYDILVFCKGKSLTFQRELQEHCIISSDHNTIVKTSFNNNFSIDLYLDSSNVILTEPFEEFHNIAKFGSFV